MMGAHVKAHERDGMMHLDPQLGNAAKQYCLMWVRQRAQATPQPLRLLDLGCGTAHYAVALLQDCPNIVFVGIEPLASDVAKARQNLQGLPATLLHGYAYEGIRPQLPHEAYDVVLSFSVFEHVYERLAYLQFVRACLAQDGVCLMNYDAGHFHSTHWKERLKTLLGGVLARLGNQAHYQAFVREADFRAWVTQAGLSIQEAKMFNTMLKGVYQHVPQEARADYLARWLELELWLNEAGIVYDDSLSSVWRTRNYVLKRA